MSFASWSSSRVGLRIFTLIAPPVGLVLLWLHTRSMGRKLLGTLGILLYSLLYAALIVWLLIKFAGLEVEWRGGYAPAFTYHKTVPNYEALERHRANAINAPTLSRSNAPTLHI